MTFTSFEFVVLFLILLLLRIGFRASGGAKWLLLVASLAFYISWSVPCVFLILFTALLDYEIGRRLGTTSDPSARRRLLMLSLICSLGLLGFFKYTNFLLENLSLGLNVLGFKVQPLRYNIVLPPGISFYTFASLSYVFDVYYQRIPVCPSARDYTLFVTFFPKLLSGPIVRAGELLPQFKHLARATAEDVEIGLSYCLMGAVKKLVIADQVAPHINLIFAAPTQYDGLTLLMGLLGYTVQIYCDFSGYSDMAIGFARVLGFRFPENFQMPLSAASITEFWRRWHITLSRWFRDYVFLPLEMATRANPHPKLRVSTNIMVMMLLVGLWHGPSWNYVIFGGIHGLALVTHKIWTGWSPLNGRKMGPVLRFGCAVGAHVITLVAVLLGFLFFRAQSFSDAISYLHRLLSWAADGTRLSSPQILSAVSAVFFVHLLVGKDRNLALELPQKAVPYRVLGYASLITLLAMLGMTGASPFIYFQF